MRKLFLFVLGLLLSTSSYCQIQINSSYLNITRPAGGPVVVGDVLEIRAVISVPSGTTINNLKYYATIPTGVSYVAGSMKVLTNEGITVSGLATTGSYTDAGDPDAGYYTGAAVWIDMGAGASGTTGGTIVGGSTPPLFYNVASILMAAYQVKVTGAVGSTITTNGYFYYTDTQDETIIITPMTLMISPAYTCGTTGSNYLTFESNGTFDTGSTLDRSTASANVTGFTFTTLTTGTPNDGQYSIVTNSSPTGYTGTTPGSGDKVFGYWDVIGDHTGSTTGAGNAPAASGTTAGYMLAVNATYAPAVVFTATITGLVANNTYNISFWLRNICPSCGTDPTSGNDNGTPGVKPNLAINVNSENYYSTGDIAYSGQWVQNAFTFVNGSSTTALLEIRNNAPGGGGNDWALDDIQMTQCLTVLPIGLQSFTGQALSDGNLLKWQIGPSAALSHFVVERSTDGSSFSAIAEVSASTSEDQYSYTDAQAPGSSSAYYRIDLVTVDGNISYSPILLINESNNTGSFSVKLGPNPAHGSTTMNIWSEQTGPASIQLIDAAGKPVFSISAPLQQGANSISLTLPERLATGIYIVRTTAGPNSTVNRLIVN